MLLMPYLDSILPQIASFDYLELAMQQRLKPDIMEMHVICWIGRSSSCRERRAYSLR